MAQPKSSSHSQGLSRPEPSLGRSASLMGLGVLSSRVLGLVREQVFAAYFGASHAADAFQIAFRIPNLLRDLFAEGALSSALVPTFVKVREQEGDVRAWRVAQRVFTLLVLVVTLVSALGIFFAPDLVGVYAEHYRQTPGKFELTVSLTQTMMPFFPFVALAAAFMGVLNACGAFFIPAFASAVFNAVSVGVGVLGAFVGESRGIPGILAFAWGVVIGGFAQAAIQIPVLLKFGFRIRWSPSVPVFKDPAVKNVFLLMIPGVIGLAATQINILVNSVFATSAGPGAVSWLNYAFRLMQFPIGIFGVSIATAHLSLFSKSLSGNQPDQAFQYLNQAFKKVFVINTLAGVGLAFLGEPIVGLIFERGQFSRSDTVSTHHALMAYALGLSAYSAVKVFVPVFYALEKAKIAVLSSFVAVGLNLILNLFFVESLGFIGLALSTSLTAILNATILAWLLKRGLTTNPLKIQTQIQPQVLFGDFPLTCFKTLGVAVALALALGAEERVFQDWGYAWRVAFGLVLSIPVVLGAGILFQLPEIKDTLALVKRRLIR